MFNRVLVANRGEIALRIIRACRELGVSTVAVYSEADAAAPHVTAADEAVAIGPSPAVESYLAIPKLIDAARATGSDAVHPGYGFLAENAAFAEACTDAGLGFIGPPAPVIELMGSKTAAREAARSAGLPIVPGQTPSGQSNDDLAAAARHVGFPALLKAAAGGGGKGMRLVEGPGSLDEAIDAARREAVAAFGDGTLYLERALTRPRHVEIQVFADARGHAVHLFERDCSVQRRHQKVIEESPCPTLSPELRARMGASAASLALAVGYRNAGTVEFLLEDAGDETRFYFLEMNTRLQVEHPVTEAVTGVDLVRAQLVEASGGDVPWRQESLTQRGHAIECRVYAEDPANDFVPQAGPLLCYREPSMPGVRIDSGVVEGGTVPVYYDPLLAKLIAYAEDRPAAIDRAITALRHFPVLGIRTNISFLASVLDDARFRSGAVHTRYLDEHTPRLVDADARTPIPIEAFAVAVAASQAPETPARAAGAPATADPWSALQGWRN